MGSLLAVSGALPALLLMWLIGRYDSARPEPAATLRKVALFGALAVIPTLVVELVLSALGPQEGVAQALWTAFVVAALTEEGFKALALWWVVGRHPAFDERLDGIVYATRAGLGFALVENVGYLLGQPEDAFLGVFVMRAVLAVPGHAIWAGFMGHALARRRFDGAGPGLVGGLAVAVALHGLYDAALFMVPVVVQQGLPVLALPLVAVPIAVVVGGYRRLRAHAAEALALDDAAAHRVHSERLALGAGFTLR
jgi:RsiW-degrading membrane proteinase PrsW (M82 family)